MEKDTLENEIRSNEKCCVSIDVNGDSMLFSLNNLHGETTLISVNSCICILYAAYM